MHSSASERASRAVRLVRFGASARWLSLFVLVGCAEGSAPTVSTREDSGPAPDVSFDANDANDANDGSLCGNGKIDPGEKCDLAITSDPGVCPTATTCVARDACHPATIVGLGCLAKCVESSLAPSTAAPDGCCPRGANPSTDADCKPACGNGVVEPGETRDDGGTITEKCPYFAPSCTVCDAQCQLVAGAIPICGDGMRDGPGSCDDGGTTPGDGCPAHCTVEVGFSCAREPSHCAPATEPPSCAGGGDGRTNCGLDGDESCCASLMVPGIDTPSFSRSYDGVGFADDRWRAQVSSFRFDKYEITVGRFRTFVAAVVAGWKPPAGAGKHAHLNGGKGVAASGGGFEPGWDPSWVTSDDLPTDRATWDDRYHLACA
jgi:cysteine-rich repeat protein